MDQRNQSGVKLAGLCALLLALAFVVPAALAEDDGPQTGGPQTFDTAEAAASALFEAARKNDDAALKALFGPAAKGVVQSGEDPTVKHERETVAKAAAERLLFEKVDEDRVVLVLGHNEWPLPIPLIRKDGKWSFDAETGREEILARRIGRNELDAIALCKSYAGAQVEYAAADWDGDEVREYAQRIISTEGAKDGLYWPMEEGSDEPLSPCGPFISSIFGVNTDVAAKRVPVNGYYWKVLKGQGPSAPGGAHSYVINGNMIAGFALVGVPADYMHTGVMTFLVSHHGKIFEKDLGETSLEIAKALEAYDPDDTWSEVGAQ